jgi:DNA-binding CsgD family transcriptional regulator/PAS domain-containing protein
VSVLSTISENEKKTLLKVLDHRVAKKLNGYSEEFEKNLLKKTNTSSINELLSKFHSELIHVDSDLNDKKPSIEYWLKDHRLKKFQLLSDQAIRILDNHTKQYLYINEANENISGLPNEIFEQKGLKYSNLRTHPWDLFQLILISRKVMKVFQKLNIEEQINSKFAFDLRYRHPEKGYIRIHQNVLPLSVSNAGKPSVILIQSTDISEIKKSNRMKYFFGFWRDGFFQKLISGETSAYGNILTSRELDLLTLAADGYTSAEIANKKNLSVETVRTHNRNIISKTGAKNLTEVVRVALVEGWI